MSDFSRVVALLGLPIDDVSMNDAVLRIESLIESGAHHQIATANLDFVRNARRSVELQRVICDCSMVLPDGAPLLWASRLMRRPLQSRVTGVDLVPRLAQLSAEKGYGIFLLGATDESAQAAMKIMLAKYPAAKFVGQYAPPIRSLDEMDDEDILERVHAANPHILLVAFGNPKQELWLARNRAKLKVPVYIGIGGSLEMIAGLLKRAPRWIQMLQMEWLFRMAQEPGRLLPRYAGDLLALLKYLPSELVTNVRQPNSELATGFDVEAHRRMKMLSTPVSLTGYACTWLTQEVTTAMHEQKCVLIDMSATDRVEADGVGTLLNLRRSMANAGLELQITGVSDAIHRVFLNSSLAKMFNMALSSEPQQMAMVMERPTFDRRTNRADNPAMPFDRRTRGTPREASIPVVPIDRRRWTLTQKTPDRRRRAASSLGSADSTALIS